MRSVVVVLPASMWAMIPMLRTLSRGLLATVVPTSSRELFVRRDVRYRAARRIVPDHGHPRWVRGMRAAQEQLRTYAAYSVQRRSLLPAAAWNCAGRLRRSRTLVPRVPDTTASPPVVREGLVRLGHLVGVLAPLDRGTQPVGGVQQLVHQALGHRLLPAGLGVADDPAQRQGGRPRLLDLDRHLVSGAADSAALHLQRGSHVVQRALEDHHRVAAG